MVFDEFQEAVGDAVIVDLLRKIAARGRGAGVHLIAATQHPTVDAFGHESTRRNLTGKLALRVADPDASRVAVGGRLPRADWLLDAGDAYTVAPGACHRVQIAYVDGREISAASRTEGPSAGSTSEAERTGAERGQWTFDQWPAYDPGAIGQELPQVKWSYTGVELGHALVSAAQGEGRPTLIKRLEAAKLQRPGSDRADRLLGLGRGAYRTLRALGWDLRQEERSACLPADGTHASKGALWGVPRAV